MNRFISFCIIYCFNISVLASEPKAQAIKQLESYVREIKSVAIDFKQTDSQRNIAIGKLLIDKPLKFRCNYYAPFPLLIVGNKNYLSVYDYDMDTLNRVEASENIFRFLLLDDIEIEKYFDIKDVITENTIVKFVLYHRELDKLSTVSFNRDNKQIVMMEIVEGNNVTNIIFNSIVQVTSFDDDLFGLKNPDVYGPPARLDKQQIEKKYRS